MEQQQAHSAHVHLCSHDAADEQRKHCQVISQVISQVMSQANSQADSQVISQVISQANSQVINQGDSQANSCPDDTQLPACCLQSRCNMQPADAGMAAADAVARTRDAPRTTPPPAAAVTGCPPPLLVAYREAAEA